LLSPLFSEVVSQNTKSLLLFLAHSANVINIILTFVVVVKYFGEAVTPRFYRIRVFSEKPTRWVLLGFIEFYWVMGFIGFCGVFLSEWRLLKVERIRPTKLAGCLAVIWKPALLNIKCRVMFH